MKKVVVIGSGFSGLSSACYLAKEGYEVALYEKNDTLGGRARRFERDGFSFDMGPTFYWMPDIFDAFFADFGRRSSDFYRLERLDPGYEIYFGKGDSVKEPADFAELKKTFDRIEPGSGAFLEKFMRKAGFNYRVAIDKVVYKPGISPLELVMPETAMRIREFVSSIHQTVRRNVKNEKLRRMLEFPVLFLGAKPSETPSFYRFMNYADMVLGSWHVAGGMGEVVNGLQKLAESLGVKIYASSPVEKIVVEDGKTVGIVANGLSVRSDAVVSGADYRHTETLLPQRMRNYSERYWEKRVFAPSAILYYIGFDKKLKNVSHHTLFFDTSFDDHASKIYDKPGWPDKPLFYASFPTKTDPSLGPEGRETAIVLIPSAAGLADTPQIREHYLRQVVERMEILTDQPLREHILFYESYAATDFIRDYNASKGNAYGLANILRQTAFLKPKICNRKLPNMFYAGQLTVPGPGVPTALISGKIAAERAASYLHGI